MLRYRAFVLLSFVLAALAACTPDYSPNTYAANAVQQANKVESGTIIGYRQVRISASGTVGAVSGGAAGGVLGAQTDVSGIGTALGAVGGTLVGGVVGTTVEHVSGDTTGWEYIVRKPNGDLLSLAQREPSPLPLGQKVLVITGNQARIIADYSTAPEPPKPAEEKAKEKPVSGEAPASAGATAPPPAASDAAPSAGPAPP